MTIDHKLKDYATEVQAKYIDAVIEYGSNQKAALALKVDRRTVDRAIEAVKKKAALAGYSPVHDMTRPVPDGFSVKGVSSYYNRDGELSGQWVKSCADRERQEQMIREAIQAMCEDIPRAPKVSPPDISLNANLANCFVLTDYHMGMLAWHEESGADWDLKISEDTLYRWISSAIELAPKADTAIFAQLGDFLHFDSLTPKTPESGHILDADTRMGKIVRASIRAHRMIARRLLETHNSVHMIISDANHDPYAQLVTREWMAALYEGEPRLTVDRSPNPYNCFEFGSTALFFHHGHKRNISNVSEVFAAQFREVYGRTKHAYAHIGHLHHKHTKENGMMIVEQHRTLAAQDAYAARGGWLSGRDAQVITYHKEYGEVFRNTINSDMIK